MDTQNVFDALYDEDNNDVIILKNERGEDISFEQIALIPDADNVYIILKPVVPMEGVGEDEGLVFLIEEDKGRLTLVVDEDIIDRVFSVYDELVAAENGD